MPQMPQRSWTTNYRNVDTHSVSRMDFNETSCLSSNVDPLLCNCLRWESLGSRFFHDTSSPIHINRWGYPNFSRVKSNGYVKMLLTPPFFRLQFLQNISIALIVRLDGISTVCFIESSDISKFGKAHSENLKVKRGSVKNPCQKTHAIQIRHKITQVPHEYLPLFLKICSSKSVGETIIFIR